MTTIRQPRPRAQADRQTGPGPSTARIPLRRIFAAENSRYFLLLGVTLFLVIFGLVMVL